MLQYPFDSSMVSPSCCLEYRPTGEFWLILFFGVFPAIYLCGKVVGTILTVLLRVLRGLCKLLLWDDEDYEEEAEELRLERQRKLLEKEEARRLRRLERAKKRAEAATRQLAEKNEKMTTLLANGAPRNGVACQPTTSDISESLNSECETDEQRVTPPAAAGTTIIEDKDTPIIVAGSTVIEERTLTNGHVTVANGGDTDATSSTLRHRNTSHNE
ncbi:hypothetical protein OESDEN_13603 [Oesophagostomum dentatum]|uniref:Uncharacterized protein n=1 Tax=Oesophagostomum dentatum TaxID=61180 RepID=A0A0B1SMX2_OESDE|nr:hypothetical protein OESDEN_13603 [Oesophagostomum dentatum]